MEGEEETENPYIHFVQDIASEMPTKHLETVKGFLLEDRSLSFEICQMVMKRRKKKRKTSVDGIQGIDREEVKETKETENPAHSQTHPHPPTPPTPTPIVTNE